jgi:hypothetical protein
MDVRPIMTGPVTSGVGQGAPSPLSDAAGNVNSLRAGALAGVSIEGARLPVESLAPYAAILDSAVLLQLSESDAGKLVRILEPPALPQQLSALQGLLRVAISAAQNGDSDGALKQLADFVRLDPNRAHTLRAEPGLEPIRAHVDQLLFRLESMAGMDAQGRLADAAKALESWGRQPLPGWDAAPQTVLAAASRLSDAGGYVNCLYAASLAQVVIEGARFPIAATRMRPADSPPKSVPVSTLGRRLKALWAHVPLLILLILWFVLGLAAIGVAAILHFFWPGQYPASIIDSGFALWGIGFLALVIFGFYMRVRRVRFR